MRLHASPPWSDPSAHIDLDAVRQALQRDLPGCAEGALQIDALRLLDARRSSSRRRDPHPVALWLEAALHEPASGRAGVQRLYGKAYRDGASAAGFDSASAKSLVTPEFGAPLAHVGTLDMLVWAWPNDPALPQLSTLLDRERAASRLPPDATHGRLPVQACEVLRYKPEIRATLRFVQPVPGRDAPRLVYGKTFADDRAATLLQRFRHFWQAALADPQAPLVAEPLGIDRDTRTLWQAAASGTPLMERARLPGATQDFFAAGQALAHLHQAALPATKARTLDHWLIEVQRRQQKIARVVPALAPRALALARALERAAARLPPAAPTLLHGDFHVDQLWIDRGRVVLFDFDEFCIGHPMEDLAEFTVKLEQSALHEPRSVALGRALLDGYAQQAPDRVCAAGLAWHRCVQALLQVSRAFVFQLPDWQRQVLLRLDRAEALARELSS